MTAVLERDAPTGDDPRFKEAVVAYVRGLASITMDFEVAGNLMPEADFIVNVASERYDEVSVRVIDLSYEVRERYGLRITSVVVAQ
jgi:hypothetical protein